MSLRPIALGAVVVSAALVALMLALGDDPPPPRPPAAAEASRSTDIRSEAPMAPAATGSARTEAPSLPNKPGAMDTTVAGEVPLWSAHEDEPRDDGWADAKERAIRERLAPLLDGANRHRPGAVAVPHVDCRSHSCRLLVSAGDRTELGRFLESLQDERGFYGDAAELALDGYGDTVDKATGTERTNVRVHLRWTR